MVDRRLHCLNACWVLGPVLGAGGQTAGLQGVDMGVNSKGVKKEFLFLVHCNWLEYWTVCRGGKRHQ